MQDVTLMTLKVSRFVGTGSFLIVYPNGHTKKKKQTNTLPNKEVTLLFLINKTLPLKFKKNQ